MSCNDKIPKKYLFPIFVSYYYPSNNIDKNKIFKIVNKKINYLMIDNIYSENQSFLIKRIYMFDTNNYKDGIFIKNKINKYLYDLIKLKIQ